MQSRGKRTATKNDCARERTYYLRNGNDEKSMKATRRLYSDIEVINNSLPVASHAEMYVCLFQHIYAYSAA